MALINQNSIIGVTSITSPSASNVLTVHTNDTTERLRVSTSGLSFSGTNASLDISGNATFNGNVSIGGTLTYEDVTNIDSVGVITARAGIVVTGGSVGIGTDIPNAPLHVEKDGTSQVLARFESNMGTNNNRSISINSPTSDSGSEPFIFNTGNGYQFQTDDQVALHINYNRNIGILVLLQDLINYKFMELLFMAMVVRLPFGEIRHILEHLHLTKVLNQSSIFSVVNH